MKKIAYFSYKGGAGRSSLAYNTIPLLAESLGATPEHPMIIIDLDIDSAGLTFLLGCHNKQDLYSTQDVVSGAIPGMTVDADSVPLKNHPFFSQLIPVGNKFGLRGEEKDASILFVPVKTGGNVSFDGTYDQAENYLYNVAKLCNRYGCKALILDTPTGDQLTAKWALDVSKDILVTMKITYQFRHGTIDFLRRKDRDFANKNFILVPNCVPTETIYVDGNAYNYEAVRQEIINTAKDTIINNRVNVEMLENGCFGVPEVKRFKLKEGILYTLENLTDDEKAAYEMYGKVTSILVRDN